MRVGVEDAIYMSGSKQEYASNLRLVERLVQVARAVGREPASPAEARTIIGLPERAPAAGDQVHGQSP